MIIDTVYMLIMCSAVHPDDYDYRSTCESLYSLLFTNFSGNETKELDIRLVGGKYLWEGRVEIFLHGVWGTFCDDGAYTNDAFVVCRQLGYTIYSKY